MDTRDGDRMNDRDDVMMNSQDNDPEIDFSENVADIQAVDRFLKSPGHEDLELIVSFMTEEFVKSTKLSMRIEEVLRLEESLEPAHHPYLPPPLLHALYEEDSTELRPQSYKPLLRMRNLTLAHVLLYGRDHGMFHSMSLNL
jgi:hypothetical protein